MQKLLNMNTNKYIFALGLMLFTMATHLYATQDADIVYRNGQIYTVNSSLPWAQAVAIKDDRFLFVGKDENVAAYIGPKTRVVDLWGKMAMPGLHDAHQHLLKAQMRNIDCKIPPASKVDQIISALKLCKEQGNTRGEWIVAFVYRGDLFPGGKAHRRYIDAAFPDTPVYIREWSFHHGLANSKALQIAGIDRDTPDPDRGKILHDENGEPTGELLSKATWLVMKDVPPVPPETIRDAVKRTAKLCNQFGITSAQDAASNEATLVEIKKLDEQGLLPLRVTAHLVVNHPGSSNMSFADMERAILNRAAYQSPHLDTDAVKIYVDGSPLQPHATDVNMDVDGNIPVERLYDSPETLNALVTRFDKMGLKVKLHAVGTGATRTALNAIAAARSANGNSHIFHDIAHSLRYEPADFVRLQELGAVTEMSPAIWQIKGPLTANLAGAWQFRSLLDHGTLVSIGSDWVVLPEPNLFPALSGLLDHGNESIKLDEALRAMTLNGAISIGKQETSGSIETGKIADMIVLDRNLFDTPSAEIANTRVLETVFEGRVVYQAEP